MEKMQKCTQENLQQILQSAEQRPERLKAALNIIEHSDNTEEQENQAAEKSALLSAG